MSYIPELLRTAPESKEVDPKRPTSHQLILADEISTLVPLATAKKAEKLRDLLKYQPGYEATSTGADPIGCCSVQDPFKQLSYPFKTFWPHRPIFGDKKVRSSRRIPDPYHAFSLLLTVMNGCWSNRAGGADAMKNLHLILSVWPSSLALERSSSGGRPCST